MANKCYKKGLSGSKESLVRAIQVANGDCKAELVIKNASWLDVFTGDWKTGDIAIDGSRICGVGEDYEGVKTIDAKGCYIVPGFIDSHVHIESSMMTPQRFEEAVLPRGTTSAIWDPHEIANVKGVKGIEWALDSSEDLKMDVFVMVPSCVPSTSMELGLESSGSNLFSADLAKFKDHPRVLGLAEMMNWPGLLGQDEEVCNKLNLFYGLRLDGHCPGLSGKGLNAYAAAGIHSCHESTTQQEASEKLTKGIHVLIREGSCAKDADALLPILNSKSSHAMGFCSDDRNPLDIKEDGHIDCIVNKALALGLDPTDVFKTASYSSAQIYGLDDRGAVAPGYKADLVLIHKNSKDDWKKGITVHQVLKDGELVTGAFTSKKDLNWHKKKLDGSKNLNIGFTELKVQDLQVASNLSKDLQVKASVIGVRPRQIVTDHLSLDLWSKGGFLTGDPTRDILKIVVIERHHGLKRIGVGFVKGFGLKDGAIATSINHDCHNIIATGSSDVSILSAIKRLLEIDGGIVVVSEKGKEEVLSLPVGGLMTEDSPEAVSSQLVRLKGLAKSVGCVLEEPFLQLSFLALPVIPSLKITDRGLVDSNLFKVIPVVSSK